MRKSISTLFVLAACGGRHSEFTKLAEEPPTSVVTGFAADGQSIAWMASGKEAVELKLIDIGSKSGPVALIEGDIFGVALDHDAIYWSDGNDTGFSIWRSGRDRANPKQLTEIDDIAKELIVSNGFVYWATAHSVGRVPVLGGATEVLLDLRRDDAPIKNGNVDRLAIDGFRIVVAIGGVSQPTQDGPGKLWQELWELDGEPTRLGRSSGTSDRLIIDGETILWGRLDSDHKTTLVKFDGTQQRDIAGTLLAASAGRIYVDHTPDATYEVSPKGTERRVGPRALAASVVGTQLCGVFLLEGRAGKETIGCIRLPGT